MCLAKQEPAQRRSRWEKPHSPWPCCTTPVCAGEGGYIPSMPLYAANLHLVSIRDEGFHSFLMQTCLPLGFYLHEQTFGGKDRCRAASPSVCFPFRFMDFLLGAAMQNTGLAQGSRAAAQTPWSSRERSMAGPPEPPAPAPPPPPKPAGVSCSLCLSKIITKAKGTRESSPETANDLSKVMQQIICGWPGGTQEVWLAIPGS